MALSSEDHEQHFSDSVVSKIIACPSSSSSSKSRTSLICNPKPVVGKRRCRASKKTPVTHLNANSSNFRALVQQFTGCPTTPLSLGSPFKGPITLNFQRGIREMQIHHSRSSATTTRPSSSHKEDNNNNQVVHVRFHQNHHQQIQSQASADDLSEFDDGVHHHHRHDQEQEIINVDDDDEYDDCVMMMEKTLIRSSGGDSSSSGVSSSSSAGGGGLQEVSDLITDHFDGFMDDISLHDLMDMNDALCYDLGYFV